MAVSSEVPYTLQLLEALANGKLGRNEVVYYRGDLDDDIDNCHIDVTRPKSGHAPRQQALLSRIKDTAEALKDKRKIKLSVRPRKKIIGGTAVLYNEYVATRV